MRKTGAGFLELDGHNTYEGGTEIREGLLTSFGDNALGYGLVKLRGGELSVLGGGTTLANPFEVSGGTISSDSVSFQPLPVTFTGAGTILPGATLTVETLVVGDEGRENSSFLGGLAGEAG